jgi:uncharacterized protein (TIGR03546 family)
MPILKPIFTLFDLIRLESSPLQVSLAILLGAFFAVTPLLTPQFALAFVVLCVVRLNLLATLLSYILFSLIAMPLQDLFGDIGRHLLVLTPTLRRLWAGLYHWPIFPFTAFNNTVVLGSGVVFTLISLPLFLTSYFLYRAYAPRVFLRIQQSRAGLSIRASLFFRRYLDHVSKNSA